MPLYGYEGVDRRGKKTTGVIETDSIKSARIKLKSMGVYPTRVMEKALMVAQQQQSFVGSLMSRVTMRDIVSMTRQMSILINAHVPLVNALTAIVDQTENSRLKTILSDVKQQVNEGVSFADALSRYPKTFSGIYVNLVRAGEISGNLGVVMRRLSDFLEDQFKLVTRVKGALTYPIVMVVIGGLAMMLIFAFVVPKITTILEDQNIPLPIYTEILIGLSQFMRSYWWGIILAAIAAYLIFRVWVNTSAGRLKFDRFRLTMPIFGDITRKVAVSRFTKTLATLLSGGVRILEAIKIAKFVVDNKVIENVLTEASQSIEEGQSIAEPLTRSGEFPPIVTHMISIGEKTGELETMLESVATGYDDEVSNAVDSMTSLLEPAMIVIMGLIVGFVVISILVPMMEMTSIG